MDGLLGLLLFAVLFFVMMRFGCGAHIMHGGHASRGSNGGHGSHGSNRGDAGGPDRDPVCGMSVAPDQGYAMTWDGRMYRFCSRQCLDKFEAEPSTFASSAEQKA